MFHHLKMGYYTDDSLPTVAALCEQANEQLFRSIKYIPTHPLQSLFTSQAQYTILHTSVTT